MREVDLLVEAIMAGLDLPELVPQRPPWMAVGACRGQDPAIFFPERGDPVDAAKAICSDCPSREPCLAFAVDGREPGIWGGTSAAERRRMRRNPAA